MFLDDPAKKRYKTLAMRESLPVTFAWVGFLITPSSTATSSQFDLASWSSKRHTQFTYSYIHMFLNLYDCKYVYLHFTRIHRFKCLCILILGLWTVGLGWDFGADNEIMKSRTLAILWRLTSNCFSNNEIMKFGNFIKTDCFLNNDHWWWKSAVQ